MPTRPPERYEPGELQKTREKLGDLTPTEARLMGERLGGEIGVEKTSPQVEKRYQELKSRKGDNTLVLDTTPPRQKEAPPKKKTMKYWDRVRTDFLCAGMEFRIKTLSQAFRSLFTLTTPDREAVSRHYIMDLDHKLIKGVENLVLALRGLTSKNFKYALQNIRRIPLYNEILRIIRNWDLDTLARELGFLQKNPTLVTIKGMMPLLRALLYPIFILARLSPQVHIQPAITKMYELVRMYLVDPRERERVLKYYVVAREEVPLVFLGLRTKIYPFLLKLLGDRFMEKDDFFIQSGKEILEFLRIEEKDQIREVFESQGGALASILSGEEPELEGPPPEVEEEMPQVSPLPPLAQRGLELADALFPRAGWGNLDTNPDLFAYFQSIFELPRGSELLDPRDPLQPVLILMVLIQNLLFGFQNMKFGTSKNHQGALVYLQEPLERAISKLHFFMEEAFGKIYLDELQNYCRNIERGSKASKDSKKSEAQLFWYKKNYFLPHLRVPILENVRIKTLEYPHLGAQVRNLLELLAPIAVDVELNIGNEITTLLNPLGAIRFQVNNNVSNRILSLLRKVWGPEGPEGGEKDGRTNRNLLFFTMSILSALDHMTNNPNSFLYTQDEGILYRTSGELRDEAPQYNVQPRNTLTFLKKLAERELLSQTHKKNLFQEDNLTQRYDTYIVDNELKTQMIRFHREEIPFTLLSFRLQGLEKKHFGYRNRCQSNLKDLLEKERPPESTIMPLPEGTLVLILPQTQAAEAEVWARKLLTKAAFTTPDPLPLLGLVIPFQKNWDKEKLLGMPSRGWALGKEFPAQVLGIYEDPNDFAFQEDLPVVKISLTMEEGLEELEDQLEEL